MLGVREKTRTGNWNDAFTIRSENRTAICAPPHCASATADLALIATTITTKYKGELETLWKYSRTGAFIETSIRAYNKYYMIILSFPRRKEK